MGDGEPDLDRDFDVERPILRIFRDYAGKRLNLLVVGVSGGMTAFFLALVPPTLLGSAIDTLFQGRSISLPLVQGLLPESQIGQFWAVVGLIVASYLAEAGFNLVRGYGLNRFAQELQHDIRTDTYDAMQRLEMQFFANNSSGELMSVLNNDVNKLEQFLSGGAHVFSRIVFTVIGVSAVLLYLNWQMALVSLLVVPLIAVFTKWFVDNVQPMYSEVRSTVGELNSLLENNIAGIQAIKANAMEKLELEEVKKLSRKYYDTNWNAIRLRITFFPGMRILAGTAFIVTFAVGGSWVLTGEAPLFLTGDLSVGEFVTFVLLTQELIWPMANFGDFVNMYQKAYASAERIFGLMDMRGEDENDSEQPELQMKDSSVVYDSVTFAYEEENVLDDVNFSADSGETVALVGRTGAGKSTAIKLLLRFYDIDGGEIRVGGADISSVSRRSLREQIGYVSQDNVMFPESVRENIAYGVENATEQQVKEAAKKAEAQEFIQNLPEGYDTDVGDKGVKLSGGQRQRIGIARAIVRNPEILVLDEATSDVDTETELRIQRGMEHLMENRTVIAVAHRLSTIKDADRIVVLEHGEVAEQGTHRELLETDGIYSKLWKVQAGQAEEVSDFFLQD